MGMSNKYDAPIFPNYGSDCMRAAMLSVIHHFDPKSPVTVEDLRLCASYYKGAGTDVALAALTFNRLGLEPIIYTDSTARIEPRSLAQAAQHKVELCVRPATLGFLQRHMSDDDMLICAFDPARLYAGAYSSSHAVVMTNLVDGPVLRLDSTVQFHETMWQAENSSVGTTNKAAPALKFEMARLAHDRHTVLIRPTDAFEKQSRLFIDQLRDDKSVGLRIQKQDFDIGPERTVRRSDAMLRLVDNVEELHILESIMAITEPRMRGFPAPSHPASLS